MMGEFPSDSGWLHLSSIEVFLASTTSTFKGGLGRLLLSDVVTGSVILVGRDSPSWLIATISNS